MDVRTNYITWKSLPLKKFKIRTFRLQCKIYKAMRNKNVLYVSKLQKILVNSFAARCTAVEELTSRDILHKVTNEKKTEFPSTTKRIEFVEGLLKKRNNPKHFPVKKILTTKLSKEKKVFQKWKTADQIVACVCTMALKPAQKANFYCKSYGFKTGKNQWGLQKAISIWVNTLSPSFKAKVLKIEMASCFDKINHDFLMKELLIPQKNKSGILQILKAGILDKNVFNTNEQIRKNVLKPFLGNLALHRIENLNESKNFPKQVLKSKYYFSKGFRYENNVVYILEENANEDILIGRVKNFLQNRNLEFDITKLDITKISDGFNLLEWRFVITPKGKLINYPNKYHWIEYKTKVKLILKNSRYKIQTRIDQVRVIVQEWHNYHQFCDMTQVKSQLYELKIWYSKYMKLYTKIPKEERILSLQRIFNNHSWVRQTKYSFHEESLYWRKSLFKRQRLI